MGRPGRHKDHLARHNVECQSANGEPPTSRVNDRYLMLIVNVRRQGRALLARPIANLDTQWILDPSVDQPGTWMGVWSIASHIPDLSRKRLLFRYAVSLTHGRSVAAPGSAVFSPCASSGGRR